MSFLSSQPLAQGCHIDRHPELRGFGIRGIEVAPRGGLSGVKTAATIHVAAVSFSTPTYGKFRYFPL